MPRPLVAIFQEFASLSFTPADADLNTCIAAVAKQVKDYDPTNADDTKTAATFSAAGFSITPKGVLPGAILEDPASVTLVDPEELRISTDEATVGFDTGRNVIVLPSTTGVTVGQPVTVGDVSVGTVLTVDGNYVTLHDDQEDAVADALEKPIVVGGISRGVVKEVSGTTLLMSAPNGPVVDSVKGLYTTGVSSGDLVYVNGRRMGVVDTASSTSVYVSESFANFDTTIVDGTALTSVIITRKKLGAFSVRSADISVNPTTNIITVSAGSKLASGETIQYAATVHAGFVARRTDLNYFQEIKSSAEIAGAVGAPDSRNPLAMAAWVALQNTGTKIIVYGVKEDTALAYAEFQKAVAPRSDIYCVVPVCLNPVEQFSVVESLRNKFTTMADPNNALKYGVPQRFKLVVAGGFAVSSPKLVTSANAVTSEQSAGQWLITSSTAKFFDRGVRVGDRVTNGTESAVVQRVVTNQSLLVDASVTGIVQVLRDLTTADRAAEFAAVSKSIKSKRVVMLLGDSVTATLNGNTTEHISAAYLACAVGGMIAGLPPHSGITNLYLSGISDIQGTQTEFDEEQLSALGDAGWCVFMEDAPSGAPYCVHGVTTDPSTVEFAEIMSVKNFDYVAGVLGNQLNEFIGTWNLNDETIGFIGSSLAGALTRLKEKRVPKLGAPVIDGTITSLAQSTTSADRAEVFVELRMPKTLNTIGLHLVSV